MHSLNMIYLRVLHLQEQYDDNINLTRSFKKSDSISTISPGFSLLLSHPRFKLDV